jgi:hypothetical protein
VATFSVAIRHPREVSSARQRDTARPNPSLTHATRLAAFEDS